VLDVSQNSGSITAGQTDWYQLAITQPEQFTVNARATAGSNLVPRLMLDGSAGQQLVQSDGGRIAQHLQPGTYYLNVSAVSGTGGYQLVANLAPALPPLRPLSVGGQDAADVVIADLNADGKPDLIVADRYDDTVNVLLGNGDGTFQPPVSYPVDTWPVAVAVADLNGDGKLDIITANGRGNDLSVLLGNGDGTFQNAQNFAAGIGPDSVVVADLNGDGIPDLVTANYGTRSTPADTVTVLVNQTAKGSNALNFGTQTFTVGNRPDEVVVADLNGDGKPDLITADYGDNTVSVLRNETPTGVASLTFASQRQTFPVGPGPDAVAVADLNGDGKPDLVTANNGAGSVSVLMNQTSTGASAFAFAAQQTFAVGAGPDFVTVGDVNGDGKPDIVAANYFSGGSTVSVLLNQTADGSAIANFAPQQVFNVGGDPRTLTIGDVNGDGKPDLVTANGTSGTVSVLAGNGDGSFQTQPAFGVGADPLAMASADLNGDGHPDLVTANAATNTVSVLLSNGDGTFQTQQTLVVGKRPDALAIADLNNDGRADLVVANENSNTVSVLLGNGDGTFQPQQTYRVGYGPDAVAVADINGDGIPDLIVANVGTLSNPGHTISVLLGNGDGTFQQQQTFDVGNAPISVAVANLTGDGRPDIVSANYNDGTVSVLLNETTPRSKVVRFATQSDLPVDQGPQAVTVAHVYGDGAPDIVVANYASGTVSLLRGKGDGTFWPEQSIPVGPSPIALAVVDLTHQGFPDIITANAGDGTASVLLGRGQGSFQPAQSIPVGTLPAAMAVTDVNGDGNLDLAVVNDLDNSVSVLLGDGNGSFAPPLTTSGIGLRNTPFLGNLDGDTDPDSVILDRSGNVLFRKGLPGTDKPLLPPVILNPGRPARDLAVVSLGTGWAVATADANFDPTLSSPGNLVYTVSLYMISSDGHVTRTTAFTTDVLPTRILAADLTGTGLPDDLVVANALDNSVLVALQTTPGHFTPSSRLPVGNAPDDIAIVHNSGSPFPDIAVSDESSGDVTILLNDPAHTFTTSERFRSDTGLYALDPLNSSPTVVSLAAPVSLAAGDFTGSGADDLAVVNRGADTVAVLLNDGNRGFTNPQTELTAPTDSHSVNAGFPGPVVVGYFHGAGQPLDLAVLMENSAEVWVYSGDGAGHFTHTFTIAAGSAPTGLSVIADAATGFSDLLVGNAFGDILRLIGDGRGHFQPPPPVSGHRTALAVLPLRPGQPLALVANQAGNTVSLQAPLPGGVQFAPVQNLTAAPSAQLAPGAVHWAKLEGSSSAFEYAVVVASGSNSVLVYRGVGFDAKGDPIFAPPVSYSAGTNPVDVTIQDINGDGIPDLVIPNQGSNDVSIIFGSLDADGAWVGRAGPRLQSGGKGPVATTLRDLNGNGVLDLVVTNQDGTMTVLPGRGQGFFDDRTPTILTIPGNPEPLAPSFFGSSDQGVVATSDGRLFGFDLENFTASIRVLFIPPLGEGVDSFEALSNGNVVAALAGGTVVELTPQDGALAIERVFAPLSGIPSDPSALQVLQGETDLQVLVTDAGGDRVFVFGIPGLPLSPPLPAAEVPSEPVIEATPTTASPLTLVLTITFGGFADQTAASTVPPISDLLSEAASNPGAAGPPTGEAPLARLVDPGEVIAQDEPLTERSAPVIGPSGINEAEKLRSIELYEPPEIPDRSVPASQIPGQQQSTVPIPTSEAIAPEQPIPVEEKTGAETRENLEALPFDLEAVEEVFLQPTLWELGSSGFLAVAFAGLGQILDVRPFSRERLASAEERSRDARG
jgi:hypothetical protein